MIHKDNRLGKHFRAVVCGHMEKVAPALTVIYDHLLNMTVFTLVEETSVDAEFPNSPKA